MMHAAEESAQQTAKQTGHNAPLVLGVTVLTSLTSQSLSEIGLDPNVASQVRRLANMAAKPACAVLFARRWKWPSCVKC